MDIRKYIDNVFGNRDGKLTVADLPNRAVLVVALVVDLVMLIAEYRVWSVGYALTGSVMLAIGFVMVSSIPFYLGQLAFLYNKASGWQIFISCLMISMGLLVSAYYGFADYIIHANQTIVIASGVSVKLDQNTLYFVAVSGTVALILGGLLYVLSDEGIANNLRKNRIEGKAQIAEEEIGIRSRLLAKLTDLARDEQALKSQFPDAYDELWVQFGHKEDSKNPTRGNGN